MISGLTISFKFQFTVPPDILYEQTSTDFAIREGENVSLVCKATGHPPPKITWRKEDGEFLMRAGRELQRGWLVNDNIITRTLRFSNYQFPHVTRIQPIFRILYHSSNTRVLRNVGLDFIFFFNYSSNMFVYSDSTTVGLFSHCLLYSHQKTRYV